MPRSITMIEKAGMYMGFSFRKSVNLGPFRITASKSGVSYSFGTKGYRRTKQANGKIRKTYSIPGTGISYSTVVPSRKQRKAAKKQARQLALEKQTAATSNINYSCKFTRALLFLLGIALICMGGLLTIVEPTLGVLAILFGIFNVWYSTHLRKTANKAQQQSNTPQQ